MRLRDWGPQLLDAMWLTDTGTSGTSPNWRNNNNNFNALEQKTAESGHSGAIDHLVPEYETVSSATI